MAPTLCRYATDPAGRLRFVDAGFCEFAAANAAPEYAVPERLYGRPLLSFISDPTTRQVYTLLMERVTNGEPSIVVPFRCDAPAVRRWLELEMTPRDGGVHFETRQLRAEPRAVPVPFDGPGTRADLLLRMCSWCNSVKVGDDTWGPIEEAVRTFGLFREREAPGITHGICPACVARFEGGATRP